MPVVSIVSLKGGVGKTSVTLGLAGAATARGLASLVVDLDPQGNATSILRTHSSKTSVANVLGHPTKAEIEAALTPCDWEIGPGEVDVPFSAQKFLYQLRRFIFQYTGNDFYLMVHPLISDQIPPGTHRPIFLIPGTNHQSRDSRHGDCSGTHWTWFKSYIHC